MMKKGCAIILLLFGVAFGAYFWLLKNLEFPINLVLSLFGSLGFLMLFSSLKQIVFGDGDAAAFKRALEGGPLQEGEVEAVWGTIHPIGEPLQAPFSGRDCVAYEYDAKKPSVTDEEGEVRQQGPLMAGFALTPSVIRSHRGDVRLLGFSMLTDFPEQDWRQVGNALENAKAFLEANEFEQMGLRKIGAVLSQMDDVMADDDGAVRKDWLMVKREAIALASANLIEKAIAPGETITAVGIWDPARGGIVPKLGKKTVMVKLLPGGGREMVAKAIRKAWGMLVLSLIWAGAVHGFIYIALTR